MSNNKEKYVVGVDLGGTKIYAAVVDRNGKIHGAARRKTKHELGFSITVERIARTVREAVQEAELSLGEVQAIGVGSPGPLDLKKGVIIDTPNLKWKNAPLKSELKKSLKKSIQIDNDGNVGVLGEYAYGAARGAKDVVGLFVGTFISIRRSGADFPWLLGCWCGLVSLAFHSFGEFNLHIPSITVTASLMAGILLGYNAAGRVRRSPRESSGSGKQQLAQAKRPGASKPTAGAAQVPPERSASAGQAKEEEKRRAPAETVPTH